MEELERAAVFHRGVSETYKTINKDYGGGQGQHKDGSHDDALVENRGLNPAPQDVQVHGLRQHVKHIFVFFCFPGFENRSRFQAFEIVFEIGVLGAV